MEAGRGAGYTDCALRRGLLCAVVAVLGLAAAGHAVAAEKPLPLRVHVAGMKVGGLDRGAATRVVEQAFSKPLTVVVDGRTFTLRTQPLATPYVDGALRHAAVSVPGAQVRLVVSVHGDAVRQVVDRIAQKVEHRAAKGDLALTLRNGKPYIAPNSFGRRLDTSDLVVRIVHELAGNSRLPMHFHTKTVEPRALALASHRVIVIDRGKNVLSLYNGTTLWRRFHVATGQSAYPTPAGRFHIVVKWVNPWWYPPPDPWAAGESPVPPGPGNPLGTRWMGLSAPGVGIHGTPEPQSIGYSLSHGCIRMLIPQAEWLFDHVDVGTTVFIL
jgi:lipoprotein-anchoring transpeptidase ErfK/SrfK